MKIISNDTFTLKSIMFKKFLNYPVFFVIVLSIIGSILYGSLLRHHYNGGEKFKSLQKIAVFFAEIPSNFKFIIRNKVIHGDVIEPISKKVYKTKKVFEKKLDTIDKKELIIISRYDGDLGRSIVEIRDLNNFEILHTYLPQVEKIYEKIDPDELENGRFINLKNTLGLNRFYMWHPAITENGDLIFHSESPLVKINYDGKVIWVNDDDTYHHSINLDLNEKIYVPSYSNPLSPKVAKFVGNGLFFDDKINIINKNGKIIFSKSVTEIFIENGLIARIFSQQQFINDPLHLNDIQPVLSDSKFFKKGDLFLSLRNLSMVILYRPSTNKIIKIIEGNFFNQHDVDIIDDKRISIYNNNVFIDSENNRNVTNSEIIIYNFESDKFSKKFEETFKKNKIYGHSHGLVDFLKDGSAIIEDSMYGRILYVNPNGKVIWEFNNLDSKKQIYHLWWARIMNEEKSKKFRKKMNK